MPYTLAFFEDQYYSFDQSDSPTTSLIPTDGDSRTFFFIDMIADFVFLCDVFVTCLSAQFDDTQGILVTNNKVLLKKYLKGYFAIDVVTSLPITLI